MGDATGGFPIRWRDPEPDADTNTGCARLCPGELCRAADAADDCYVAILGRAARRRSQRSDSRLEQLYITSQLCEGFQWKHLPSGGRAHGDRYPITINLLCEEY